MRIEGKVDTIHETYVVVVTDNGTGYRARHGRVSGKIEIGSWVIAEIELPR